jgi:hypothetical protein
MGLAHCRALILNRALTSCLSAGRLLHFLSRKSGYIRWISLLPLADPEWGWNSIGPISGCIRILVGVAPFDDPASTKFRTIYVLILLAGTGKAALFEPDDRRASSRT